MREYCITQYGACVEYLIASIVQYEPDIWNWINSDVIFRMVKGVSLLRLERVFAQMLKYDPLIISGKEIIYIIFTYGSYKMMEIVSDLCEPDLIDIIDIDDVPKDIIQIDLCLPRAIISQRVRQLGQVLKAMSGYSDRVF